MNVVSKKATCFVRSASKKLEISTRKVRNILRLSLLKAFKAKVRQKLSVRQRKARVDASKALLNKQRILPHTWFTDESWFYLDGIVQTSRGRMNTTGHCLRTPRCGAHLKAADVSAKGLIGP